jgi:AcrR family transcriptional regulator
MTTSPRPLRADAARNREKIVAAARETFAEAGLTAQMDDIAARAGVGVGTLYRHFPTKDALVQALVLDHFARFTELGREALAREDADAWTAFSDFMWQCAERHEEDRALNEVLSSQPAELPRQCAFDTGLAEVTSELMRRAQDAGAVRRDALPTDVPLLMCGLGAVLQSRWGEDAWRRYLTIGLDGLRASPGAR